MCSILEDKKKIFLVYVLRCLLVVPLLPWKCRLLQSLGINTKTIAIIYVYALFETLSFFKTFDINGRKAKNDGV